MRIAAVFAWAALAAAAGMALPVSPTATAYPGDPMPGCETQLFATYCDGPIRPDGSWKRCLFAKGSYNVPPVQNCFVVPGLDQIPPTPLGQPDHHVD